MSALETESKHLEKAAQMLQQKALAAGADKAEVCGQYFEKTKLTLEKGDFHLASTDRGYQLGLRVLNGNQSGFTSSNSTDEKDLESIATQAVSIASFSPGNPHESVESHPPIEEDLQLCNEQLVALGIEEQRSFAQSLHQLSEKDKRFRLNDGAVELVAGTSLISNSQGTLATEKDAQLQWSLMGMGVDGENITSFDYISEMVRDPKKVREHLETTVSAFTKQVLCSLKTGTASSYKGKVLFTPRAVVEILFYPIAYHLSGRNLAEATTRWKLENIDSNILNSKITVKDLPLSRDRTGSGSFDREGHPTSNQTVIENGKLKSFFFDQYSANAMKTQSTGHAVGGPTGLPGVGAHSLSLSGGTANQTQLVQAVGQNTFLRVNRFSGQADPVTGDFSGVAKGAEWWINGERAFFVKETLVSGNVFDVLGLGLVEMSQDTQLVHCGAEAPFLLADNISVTAK